MDRRDFILGASKTGEDIILPWSVLTQNHLHVMGDSGTGKTTLLESLCRQAIVNDVGFTLIDPHGHLYNKLLAWLSVRPRLVDGRRIHLFDPASPFGRVGFNPLSPREHLSLEVRVDRMLQAFERAFDQDMKQTPRLRKALRAVLYVLGLSALTVMEARFLISWEREKLRELLTSNLPPGLYREVWADFNSLPRREFNELFESTVSRLMEFGTNPAVESTFCQNERTIDWYRVMEEGEIVLVNLKPGALLSEQNAETVGAIIINHLFATAVGARKADQARPHLLIIDEAYQYLTGDIERMLVQTRKFGLHVVLAHHFLHQLRERGDNIFHGVLKGARAKVFFSVNYEDALELAPLAMPHRLATDEPKRVLDKPVAVGQETTTLRSRSEGEADGVSSGVITPSGATSESSTEVLDADGNVVGVTQATGQSVPDGPTYSEVTIHQTTRNRGEHEALKTVYKVMPTATYTPEEQRHRAALELHEQPVGRALLKLPGQRGVLFSAEEPDPTYGGPHRVEELSRRLVERSDCTTPVAAIEREFRARELDLLEAEKRSMVPVEPSAEDYWQKG